MAPATGRGFAPINTTPQKREDAIPVSFDEWHKKTTKWIDGDNQFEQWRRWRKWNESLKFFRGEQLIWWDGDDQFGYWKPVDLEDGDPYYASNIYADYINAVVAELMRSNGQMLVSAKTDQWNLMDAAIAAKHALMDEERRIWTPRKVLRFLYFLTIYGNALVYTCWRPDQGPQVQIPQFQQQQVPFGFQAATCPQCGKTFPYQGESQCPGCGSQNLMVAGNNAPLNMPQFQGMQQVQGGNVDSIIPDPTQIKVHCHARDLSETPYLRWDQWPLRIDAMQLYPNGDFETGATQGGEREMRQYERENESAPGNMTGMGAMGTHEMQYTASQTDKDLVRIRRYWLRPQNYFQTILSEPWQTESQGVIPAGTALIEVFPKGMLLVKTGDQVLDADERVIEKEWVHCGFNPDPTRFWADGMESLIQQQREYNELRSVELENAFFNATPGIFFNPKKYKRGTIDGKARRATPMENAMPGDNPAEFIWMPPARQLGGDLPRMRQDIKGDCQLHSSAPVMDSGIAGAADQTATGISIVRDWTNTKLARPLSLFIECKLKRAEQNLELIQKFWTGDRYVKISNESGMDDGRWFSGSDIQGDFDITMKPGSWWPRSPMEEKDNMLQLLVAGGVPFGVFNPQFPKKAAMVLTQALGFPMDMDGYSNHVKKQRREIDMIKQLVPTAMRYAQMTGPVAMAAGQMPVDPNQLIAQQVPVEETDDDGAHIDTIKNYLNTDLGSAEDPQTKAAIIAHMHMHEMAQVQKAQQQQMLAMMAMPPMMGAGGPPQGPPPGKGQPPPKGGNNPGAQPPQ